MGVTGGLDRRESKCDNVCRGRRPTMRMLRVPLRRDHPGPHPHCGATVARRFPVRRARYFGQRLDEDPSTGGQPLRRVRGARRATPNDSVPTTRDHRPVVQAGPGSPGWSVWGDPRRDRLRPGGQIGRCSATADLPRSAGVAWLLGIAAPAETLAPVLRISLLPLGLRAAGHHDVEPGDDTSVEELRRLSGQRPQLDELTEPRRP